jgi:hypothetical protein
LLVVGCWLLVVGCWLLVVGCWLLVVACRGSMMRDEEERDHSGTILLYV